MEERLLTYAILNGELKHILSVDNGLACNCVCPGCGQSLVARNKGKIRIPHFAHATDVSCFAAYESALHLLAKKVLETIKAMYLPDFYGDRNDKKPFKKGKVINFDEVILEKPILGQNGVLIRADASALFRGKEVIIEFANTHFIDQRKEGKLISRELACIEIDLTDQELNEDMLKKFLLSDNSKIYWVNNPHLYQQYLVKKEHDRIKRQQNQVKRDFEQKLADEELERKRIIAENEIAKKFYSYLYDKNFKLFTPHEGFSYKCPILSERLTSLKNSKYYQIELIKQIIDGGSWNRKIYGRPPYGSYIFLGKERKDIYPDHSSLKAMNANEKEMTDHLYAGVKRIQEIYSDDAGFCGRCKYMHTLFTHDGKEYVACRYPTS